MLMETELIESIQKITLADYDAYNTKNENIKLVCSEYVIAMLEDLLAEVDSLQEKLEDMQRYYEANYEYKPEPDPDVRR